MFRVVILNYSDNPRQWADREISQHKRNDGFYFVITSETKWSFLRLLHHFVLRNDGRLPGFRVTAQDRYNDGTVFACYHFDSKRGSFTGSFSNTRRPTLLIRFTVS